MGIFSAKKEIGPETVLQRKQDILFNEIDGEVVILSVENGEYYGMDSIGSRIWELLKDPINIKAIVQNLVSEFMVSEDQCHSDTAKFINELISKNLIVILSS